MEIIKTLAECFAVQCFFWLIGGTVNYFRTGKFFIVHYKAKETMKNPRRFILKAGGIKDNCRKW